MGLVISIFTRRRVSAYFFFRTLEKNEITSPLGVLARFRGRWAHGCMRHATAAFGLLVHRLGMISVGLHARVFFRNWTPKTGGISRGAPPYLHKSEATVIDNTLQIS